MTFFDLLKSSVKNIDTTRFFWYLYSMNSTREVSDMTVRDYRVSLAWSITELSRRSGLSTRTINRIEDGVAVYDYTLAAVARAFSEALGRTITINDFEGVKTIKT